MNVIPALRWLALLPLTWCLTGLTQPPAETETAQLLDWLGVMAVADQASTTLDFALAAERRALDATAREEARWRRSANNAFNTRRLRDMLLDRVTQRRDAALFRHASALLQQPLARRVRYFESAMTQRGAASNLKAFLGQLPVLPPDPERRALLAEIDAATRQTRLVALLQTAAAQAARRAANVEPFAASRLAAEQKTREAYLRPLLIDYLLYAYRYLKDDELRAYRDLLREHSVQAVVEEAEQAWRAALAAALPPPG